MYDSMGASAVDARDQEMNIRVWSEAVDAPEFWLGGAYDDASSQKAL